MAIQTLGVVGAGQMGSGIAQVAAQAGLKVVMTDISDEACRRGLDTIATSLDRFVKKEKITAGQKAEALGRITAAASLEALRDAEFIVEAATEKEDLKTAIFASLGKLAAPGAILASNTSSISITRLGKASGRPAQFIGMHFMNPVPMMKLVEIIRGLGTSDATHAATAALAASLGKTVVTAKDYPGFLANRMLMPLLNEAMYALMEGIGTPEDIDTTMKLGMSHPMGPLQLSDFIGLDTCLAIMEVLLDGLGDPKYRPCPLLRQYVDAGYLGVKSGRGFYNYAEKKA